jgi:outer membrane lipoprotein-sorting protein
VGNEKLDNNDDIVQRSLDALHREHVPHGPSMDVTQRTLAALKLKTHAASGVAQREDYEPKSNLFTRILTMTVTQRIAAAVMLTVGGLVVWFMFALFGGFGTVSYAQVAQQIKNARSMTFTMTTASPQLPKPVEAKLYALEPGMLRNEGSHGVVTILRREGDRIRVLALSPATKSANLVEASSTEAGGRNPDFVAELRALADKPGEPLGERQVGDVAAKGFKVLADGQTVSLWVHPKTALPLLIEMETSAGKVVLSDIRFDVPLDEKLFTLDVPEGYKLSEQRLIVTMDLEANVLTLLQAYTKASGGAFPEKLNNWGAYSKALSENKGNVDDARHAASAVGVVTAMLSTSKEGEDYAYTGKDAKLGDAKTIVFWHRDKTKKTYRAIYADLTAKDVTAADLPAAE